MQRFKFTLLASLGLLVAGTASADTLSLNDVQLGAPGQSNSVGVHYFSTDASDTVSILVDAPSLWQPSHISSQAYLFDTAGQVLGASGVGILSGNAGITAALAAGTYIVAVGDFPFSAQEAWAGVNNPQYWEQLGIGTFQGTYDLTIKTRTANLDWAAPAPPPGGGSSGTGVPELSADAAGSALMLLMGGLFMVGDRRRRALGVAA